MYVDKFRNVTGSYCRKFGTVKLFMQVTEPPAIE